MPRISTVLILLIMKLWVTYNQKRDDLTYHLNQNTFRANEEAQTRHDAWTAAINLCGTRPLIYQSFFSVFISILLWCTVKTFIVEEIDTYMYPILILFTSFSLSLPPISLILDPLLILSKTRLFDSWILCMVFSLSIYMFKICCIMRSLSFKYPESKVAKS